jgi:hypothetical protein
MGPSEIGLESGPAKRTGQRRRWLARLGAAVYIAALLIAAGFVLGVGPPGEPGTIHVFGRDYQRMKPCCEWGQWFAKGPIPMDIVLRATGDGVNDAPAPVFVRLEGFPLGWPLGFAVPVAAQDSSSLLVWLQEGQDAYYPDGSGGTDP